MRIDRLLVRDELPGFVAVKSEAGAVRPAATPIEPIGGAEPPAAEAPKKPAPMYGRDGRPPRRFRRAL
jgi:hypothetical protein